MIESINLQKSFGNTQVFKDINLKIEEGDIYGLVGRSGAGKSTFLRCINGLEKYDSGSLMIDGIEVRDYYNKGIREFRKNIGMIFQHFSLMNRKTVYENIALPMECWKYNKKDIDKRVKELLELVGLEEKMNDKPKILSGGQKQRVAIARALALNPKILLCDEATSALDPKTTSSILKLLRDINEKLGITIVVVTHQMSVIREICTKVGILEHGELLTKGDVEDIFLQQPQSLINLLGEEENSILPSKGKNIRMFYRKEDIATNIISRMARKSDVDFSIVWGKLEKYRDGVLGSIVINTEEENVGIITDYLTTLGIKWRLIDNGQ
ncbi:DL-methionine transporter subunit; ATP-binding component of ABC superfamily [Acetoanaerobium sticklandii]|uniref:DL-methionine transporter subunit ATP-binding component of ABC superfamily n=1 Tax=Acetoanaerobium sticklandii (strain ATCC 12662 / DSM 519 / JCM 1433 / CCUG 9281 / NCIMB 10654 / HF) TaxID=499177 RepID=E3PR23_ACESD|nr:methionine ABC transporter ATP-binding protein [Acetoanaerobium sticklandii]CBH20219.1 DL-methionine transporter subunit; ATP-binding component of ABC superfamily [Acetoanaerobium sticklandii]